MQIQILAIEHQNKVGKSGRPFVSCSIKTFSQSLEKEVWLKGFGDNMTETWSAGDTIDIDIEQNGEYYNWKKNDNTKASPDKKLEILKRIEMKLDMVLGKEVAKEIAKDLGGEMVASPTNEIKVGDLPF